MFSFQYFHFPHRVHPVEIGLCTTSIAILKPCNVVQKPLTTGLNPVGHEFLDISQLSESFGHSFGVFFIHKRIGVAGVHQSAMQVGDSAGVQFSNDELRIAAVFFRDHDDS